jgi:hypothetical protein
METSHNRQDWGQESPGARQGALSKINGIGNQAGELSSAADLKFLQQLQQTLLGTSNRKAALQS